MRRTLLAIAVVLLGVAAGHAATSGRADRKAVQPQYQGDKLVRPDNYREWIYLSSGLGMNYNAGTNMPALFTNVFVVPWAYHEFVATGKWPEKSMFVVEDRTAESKGSINKTGHFQTDLVGIAVEVKDSARFADKWAYFGFGGSAKTAEANPKAACWQCHEDNAAVEHTFVQFYPTLKPVAQKFGTYRKDAENVKP
jgi:cytochrome P460